MLILDPSGAIGYAPLGRVSHSFVPGPPSKPIVTPDRRNHRRFSRIGEMVPKHIFLRISPGCHTAIIHSIPFVLIYWRISLVT